MNAFRFFLRCWVGAALLFASLDAAMAQTALQTFFKNPQIGTASLSPNGKFLATTTTIDGVLQLAIVDLETNAAKNIAGYEKLDIFHIRWISDNRLVFDVINRGSEHGNSSSFGGLYAINRDGTKSAALMPTPEHQRYSNMGELTSTPLWMRFVAVSKDDPNSIIAIGYFYNGDAVPYRVDSVTERRKEIYFKVPGLARDFVFDNNNVLRVVVTTNVAQTEAKVWYREAEEQPWKMLSEHSYRTPKFRPLAFDADNATLLVVARAEAGKDGIFKYDLGANKVGELIASDKGVDVDGDLVFAPDTHKLLGVRIASEPPRTLWLDKTLAGTQAGLDRALAGLVNVIEPGNAQAAMLIHSFSSTHPGNFAAYYPDKKKLQNLFAVRPGVDPKKMSEQLIYDYVARDSLALSSYLTLPKGREAKALALVVYPHGGPNARDYWGFDPTVQFLAGMGYAVLQPQFRGSTGYGDDLYRRGFRQWGLSMQDDITDGVMSLVKQGVVDPKRVCIMGASYGGYATMMGLAKDPDLYRCGVNLLGVTNLHYMFTEGRWSKDKAAEFHFKETMGDPDTMKDQFTATSPAKLAEKIKAPVFMAYGEKDSRVPLIHGEDMRDALKKHGKVYEYMELKDEEHGFSSEEVKFKVYGAIETFLKKCNPPN
jgi:dipeptidyl aminopeptidase/acylaminoacyl peptidase